MSEVETDAAPKRRKRVSRLAGMALTAKQQAVWDLRRPISEGGQGKTTKEISAILGLSPPVISKYLVTVRKKLGLDGARYARNAPIEDRAPETAAQAIVAASDPAYQKLREAYEAAGLKAVGEAVIKRLRVKYSGVVTETRNLQRKELSEMLGKKIHLAMSYMDDKVMAEASYRDLALGTAALLEKKQLIDGQPTQIISDHERKKLHELAPVLIAEFQRRGLTIEGKAGVVVEPA